MFYPSMVGSDFTSSYASVTAAAAESAAREARTDTELIQHDIDRLLLITEALWTLMKREHGYTDDVLTGLIHEIDQRRVVVNGVAVKDPPQICSACGKPNQAKRVYCMYCGKPLSGNPFAR